MASKTKIKKDNLGLYATCDGYIARPFYGTIFNEGDEVKSHHFGGSSMAGVTVCDKPETHNFKSTGSFEVWTTTVTSFEYNKKDKDPALIQLFREKHDWYENKAKIEEPIFTKHNAKFKP